MRYREFHYLVCSDLYRHAGKIDIRQFMYHYRWNMGFRYSFWFRVCQYWSDHRIFRYGWFRLARYRLRHYMIRYGIDIPYRVQIKSGFYIGHFGQIIVHPDAVIGKNCNISQGVTIGQSNRGARKGCPTVGDNVFIGPGAKLFGNIRIGNQAAIGANSVVTKDVPDRAVVVGIPGRIISYEGTEGYVCHTDYPSLD